MPRAGPKKVQEYSAEFKVAAVRLSRQRGVQVQAVAGVHGEVFRDIRLGQHHHAGVAFHRS